MVNNRNNKMFFETYKMADGGANRIKVNMTELASKVATLKQSFEELEAATTLAKQAGIGAVAAAGGPSTGVGAAIQSAIADISDDQLKTAREQLDLMIDQLSKIQTHYSDMNSQLLESIKKIAANNAGGTPTAGPSSGGGPINYTM